MKVIFIARRSINSSNLHVRPLSVFNFEPGRRKSREKLKHNFAAYLGNYTKVGMRRRRRPKSPDIPKIIRSMFQKRPNVLSCLRTMRYYHYALLPPARRILLTLLPYLSARLFWTFHFRLFKSGHSHILFAFGERPCESRSDISTLPLIKIARLRFALLIIRLLLYSLCAHFFSCSKLSIAKIPGDCFTRRT